MRPKLYTAVAMHWSCNSLCTHRWLHWAEAAKKVSNLRPQEDALLPILALENGPTRAPATPPAAATAPAVSRTAMLLTRQLYLILHHYLAIISSARRRERHVLPLLHSCSAVFAYLIPIYIWLLTFYSLELSYSQNCCLVCGRLRVRFLAEIFVQIEICTVQVALIGYYPAKGGGDDQSIGPSGSHTFVRSWLWSSATWSCPLGYCRRHYCK